MPGESCFGGILLTPWGTIPCRVMLLCSVMRKNSIVLFTVVSVESDEIENSSYFKNLKHTLNLHFI